MDAFSPTYMRLIFENMTFIISKNTLTLYQQNVAGTANYRTSLPRINLETGFDFLSVILDRVLFKKYLSTASSGHFPQATQWAPVALPRVRADIRH